MYIAKRTTFDGTKHQKKIEKAQAMMGGILNFFNKMDEVSINELHLNSLLILLNKKDYDLIRAFGQPSGITFNYKSDRSVPEGHFLAFNLIDGKRIHNRFEDFTERLKNKEHTTYNILEALYDSLTFVFNQEGVPVETKRHYTKLRKSLEEILDIKTNNEDENSNDQETD